MVDEGGGSDNEVEIICGTSNASQSPELSLGKQIEITVYNSSLSPCLRSWRISLCLASYLDGCNSMMDVANPGGGIPLRFLSTRYPAGRPNACSAATRLMNEALRGCSPSVSPENLAARSFPLERLISDPP